MISNYPSGNTTSFTGKINELEEMIFSNNDVQEDNTVKFKKKKALKKIKTVFRQLDNDITTSLRSK